MNMESPLDNGSLKPKGSTPISKAIVIIPGLLGSNLRTGNYSAWIPSTDEAGVTLLALTESGSSVYSVNSVDNYGTMSTYQKLYNELKDAYYNYGYDIIFFDYDWRMNNSYTASLLASQLSGYSEVVLVAHSMGGLVAAKFLSNSSTNRAKTKALITVGTPFLGSAKAIYAMETGKLVKFVDYIYEETVKSVGRNSFAAYQLLPTTNYRSIIGIYPFTVAGASYSNCYTSLVNTSWGKTSTGSTKVMFSSAADFHSSLGLGNNHIIYTSGVPVYTIGGTGCSTIAAVNYNSNYTIDDITEVTYGDDTVLTTSAGNGMLDIAVHGVSHNELVKNDTVIYNIIDIISSETGISVSSARTLNRIEQARMQAMTSDNIVVNERGWLMGYDNRRITIIAEGVSSINLNGETLILANDKVLTKEGVVVGHFWTLGGNNRVQYSLYDGNYTFICDDYVKIKYMNSGYYDRVVEYEMNGIISAITIMGYDNSPVCIQSECELQPTSVYNESQISMLNQD